MSEVPLYAVPSIRVCGATRSRRGAIRAKMEQLERFQGLLPEIQSQNLALTVLHVPDSLDGGSFTAYCLLLILSTSSWVRQSEPLTM